MKKLLLFTFALFLWTGAWADKTVYLNPDMWAANDPNYDVYVFNGTEENAWIEMDMSAPVIVNGVTCYKAVVPTKWASMTIVRHNPAASRTSWADGEKWNQSQDITLSGVADNTLFTVTDWGNATPSANPVATYTANFTNSIGWNEVYAYAYTESGSTTKYTGEWPGAKLTAGTISFFATEAPANIIFNCGYGGTDDAAIKPYYQTENLTFSNDMIADVPAIENGGFGSAVLTGGDSDGKTLYYTYQYTQSEQNVTLTFTNVGTGVVGLTPGYVQDTSNGGIIEHAGLSYIWENCVPGQLIKAKHKWEYNANMYVSPEYSYTTTGPAAKTPEEDLADVLAVYSDTYGAEATMTEGTAVRGGISNRGWQGGFDEATESNLGVSDKVIYVRGAQGFGMYAGADVTDYDFFNVSIYSSINYDGHVRIEGGDTGLENLPFTLTAGQWNNLRIPLSGSRANISWIYLMVSSAHNNNIAVDNMYFSKRGADELVISSEDTYGKVSVEGNLSSTNKDQLSACIAAAIDLTGAVIAEETGAITTANPNVMFVINEADLSKISGTSNIVKIADAVWNVPLTSLSFTDANGNRIYTGKSLSGTGAQNKSYTRTIAADRYVTTVVPVTTDIPTGAVAYEFTGYENGIVTLTKVDGTQLTPHTPYVLYAEEGANLTFTSAGDVQFGEHAGIEIDGATFKGTYKQIATDGTQWIISNSQILNANGATIGGFRAYFTGISAATGKASILFVEDGETTHIGSIDANGEINVMDGAVYNLAGQRVAHPTKGLYIVNGKKVIIK